jgi:hypothetical protein
LSGTFGQHTAVEILLGGGGVRLAELMMAITIKLKDIYAARCQEVPDIP